MVVAQTRTVAVGRSGQILGILKLKQIRFLDCGEKREGVKGDPKVVGWSTWKDEIASTEMEGRATLERGIVGVHLEYVNWRCLW